MTAKEAIEMLEGAPCSEKPSRVNPRLSERQVVDIIGKGLDEKPDDWTLSHLYEKRIYQAVRNQRRPRYQSSVPRPPRMR